MNDIVAEREIVCVFEKTMESKVLIQVHQPTLQDGLWYTYVEMGGLLKQPVEVRGVDSLQALSLALELIKNVLKQVKEEGGKVFWADKSAEIDLDAELE